MCVIVHDVCSCVHLTFQWIGVVIRHRMYTFRSLLILGQVHWLHALCSQHDAHFVWALFKSYPCPQKLVHVFLEIVQRDHSGRLQYCFFWFMVWRVLQGWRDEWSMRVCNILLVCVMVPLPMSHHQLNYWYTFVWYGAPLLFGQKLKTHYVNKLDMKHFV